MVIKKGFFVVLLLISNKNYAAEDISLNFLLFEILVRVIVIQKWLHVNAFAFASGLL